MSKPRSDSKLFTLPVAEQQEIFGWLKQSGYVVVKERIRKEKGISVSVSTLSDAWNTWAREELEHRVLKSKGCADDVIKMIGSDLGKLDRATQAALQQTAFELAMTGGDPKTVKSFYTLLLKSRQLDIEVEKISNALKTAQEKALDLLFEDIKGNPKAEKLFHQMRDALTGATDEAVKNLK